MPSEQSELAKRRHCRGAFVPNTMIVLERRGPHRDPAPGRQRRRPVLQTRSALICRTVVAHDRPPASARRQVTEAVTPTERRAGRIVVAVMARAEQVPDLVAEAVVAGGATSVHDHEGRLRRGADGVGTTAIGAIVDDQHDDVGVERIPLSMDIVHEAV